MIPDTTTYPNALFTAPKQKVAPRNKFMIFKKKENGASNEETSLQSSVPSSKNSIAILTNEHHKSLVIETSALNQYVKQVQKALKISPRSTPSIPEESENEPLH